MCNRVGGTIGILVFFIHRHQDGGGFKELDLLVLGDQQFRCHVPLWRVLPQMFGERRYMFVALSARLTLEFFFKSAGFSLADPASHKLS